MGRLLEKLTRARHVSDATVQSGSAGPTPMQRRGKNIAKRLPVISVTPDPNTVCPDVQDTPHGTDWSWRPKLWRNALTGPEPSPDQGPSHLGHGINIFHDCPRADLTLKQTQIAEDADPARFGLSLEVGPFDGSFLSIAIDLPEPAMAGLTRQHLIRATVVIDAATPIDVFARLNLQHGPNTAQLLRKLPLTSPENAVDFDLAYSRLNERRVARGWLDLIFEKPAHAKATIRDLSFARHPRAAF